LEDEIPLGYAQLAPGRAIPQSEIAQSSNHPDELSAAVPRGVNVAIFPGVCASDRIEVVEGAALEKLGPKAKA
jgi:hypothetical protein